MKLTQDEKTTPNFRDGSLIFINKTPYRILSHLAIKGEEKDAIIWLIDLTETSRFVIITKKRTELINGIGDRTIVSCTDTDEYKHPDLQKGDLALTQLRLEQVRKYVDSLYPNYSVLQSRSIEKTCFDEICKVCRISNRNMRKYVLRYLQQGGTLLSVTDTRLIKRSDEKNTSYKGKVPGKKAHGKSSEVENDERLFELFEEAFRNFNKAINKYDYDSKDQKKPTLKSTYDKMLLKHFSVIDEETGQLMLLPEDKRPSFQRFYRYVCKYLLNGGNIKGASSSARNKRNNSRLLVGTADYGAYNPMDIVEIDETEPSVQLLSANPLNPGQIIGNGITYIAIDVITRRIVGASVSLTNNSYEGFLNLMDSMMMSDEENATILGVELDPNKPVFPGRRLPREIRVDHGSEYTSHAIRDNLTGGRNYGTMEGIPIAINLAPVAMGSMKGTVERFFGELDTRVKAAVNAGMGYVTSTYKSGHIKEACMNIEDYRMILYEMIKKHNNTIMVDYPITPKLYSAIDELTPNTLWDYLTGVEGRLSGFNVSDDEMRIAARYGLMKRSDNFKLSRRQISYRNTLYWDLGDDEALIHRAIVLGDKKEKIENMRYDPRTVDYLYKLGDDGIIRRYGLAKKRSNMEAFSGMRWADVDKWITEFNSQRYEAIKKRDEANMLAEYEIKKIAEEASNAKPDVGLITENRKEARKIEHAAINAYDMRKKDEIFFGKNKDDLIEGDEYDSSGKWDEDTDDEYIVSEVISEEKPRELVSEETSEYKEILLDEVELDQEVLESLNNSENVEKAKKLAQSGIDIKEMAQNLGLID